MASFTKSRQPQRERRNTGAIILSAARDILLPYVVFVVLRHAGMTNVAALCWAAAVSGLLTLWGVVRSRRLSVLSALVLVTVLLALAVALLTGDAQVVLARDAVITGGLGLVFLGSVLASRPMLFLLIRSLSSPEPARAALERRWADSAPFRSAMKATTAAWGACLVVDALLRLVLVYTLRLATAAAAVTGLTVLTVLVMLALLRWYLPRRLRQADTPA